MTEQINSSRDIANDIVYDLSSIYCNDSLVHSLSTLPIAETMCMHSETKYSILERGDINITKLSSNIIKMYADVLCKKITLLNFPVGQYILNLNGQNCATAKCENSSSSQNGQDYSFDFSQEEHSKTTASFICCCNDPTEPVIENRDHYINLSRVDSIRIISFNHFQEGVHKIKLEGYCKENNQWLHKDKIIEIYPNSYQLHLNQPTDCIDLRLQKINPLDKAHMIFRIDGEIYAEYALNDFDKCIRIKCKDLPNRSFKKGAQNLLLPEHINQNTINFSFVNGVELILINCLYAKPYQFRYMCYAYPSRTLIYA